MTGQARRLIGSHYFQPTNHFTTIILTTVTLMGYVVEADQVVCAVSVSDCSGLEVLVMS